MERLNLVRFVRSYYLGKTEFHVENLDFAERLWRLLHQLSQETDRPSSLEVTGIRISDGGRGRWEVDLNLDGWATASKRSRGRPETTRSRNLIIRAAYRRLVPEARRVAKKLREAQGTSRTAPVLEKMIARAGTVIEPMFVSSPWLADLDWSAESGEELLMVHMLPTGKREGFTTIPVSDFCRGRFQPHELVKDYLGIVHGVSPGTIANLVKPASSRTRPSRER
jgi:hypothetical protein